MTFLYKWLGIPRTFDEVLDNVRRKKDNQINVFFGAYQAKYNFGDETYYGITGIQIGKTKLKLNEKTYVIPGGASISVIGNTKIKQTTLKEAIETTEKLQSLGLKATINGESIDKAKENLVKYGKTIEKLSLSPLYPNN